MQAAFCLCQNPRQEPENRKTGGKMVRVPWSRGRHLASPARRAQGEPGYIFLYLTIYDDIDLKVNASS
jgi:hypothetical protein